MDVCRFRRRRGAQLRGTLRRRRRCGAPQRHRRHHLLSGQSVWRRGRLVRRQRHPRRGDVHQLAERPRHQRARRRVQNLLGPSGAGAGPLGGAALGGAGAPARRRAGGHRAGRRGAAPRRPAHGAPLAMYVVVLPRAAAPVDTALAVAAPRLAALRTVHPSLVLSLCCRAPPRRRTPRRRTPRRPSPRCARCAP